MRSVFIRDAAVTLVAASLWCGAAQAVEPEPPVEPKPVPAVTGVEWLDDYGTATRRAQAERKLLVIFFHAVGADRARDAFESQALPKAALAHGDRFVWARLPVNAHIRLNGRDVRLLDH